MSGVELRAVTKTYGSGATAYQALRGVDLTARPGEFVMLSGPSGSGKTTLLSVLSGILRPDSGTVSVEGVDVWKLNADQLADFRLNKIGFVFQDYHLFPRLTTAENVAIPLILKKKDWNESVEKATTCLDIVGLKARRSRSRKAERRRAAARGDSESYCERTGHSDYG